MIKRIAVAFAAVVLLTTMASAQTPNSSGTSNSASTSRETSKKTASFSGRVSADGKTLTAEIDGVVWSFVNPDALADNAGARVVVRGYVDATNHKIEVTLCGSIQWLVRDCKTLHSTADRSERRVTRIVGVVR